MRLFLILLLTIAIPFNAAFAAAVAWCDELQHATHPGHHVHVHDHEHGNDGNHAAGNVVQDGSADSKQHASGHPHHSHAHPVFSPMLPTPIGLHLPITTDAPPTPTAETFISAPPARLERPPRFAPVA